MRFKPIFDVAHSHDLFVANKDVGKGREQDAISFARDSKYHQYYFTRASRPHGYETNAERSHIITDWY